ncbi:MAG: 2,3-bisphosphoglycerate-independent phosphoglycerate mutase [Candidatus Moranbacteria bacterium GW2011_GWE1_35_17]|nr:MAG: 2,3-bisphosphoglycerate-independent phosphoglycerate mutase [Candidatus Moranbacteria bacterium GW2011_GWE1_35_17]KKP81573.1 MAG: 2,3-bisphosphoglycerate-independent phosphoglycerate mutase [Candidatus Moranbacteria bacterium GW2011_GWF1_35_5]KKP83861.1 MAG: 2,3-bisphosphoglycerate-independent phosphoglycerate mutase [Candidatus Moranbacteria bacterium GW2011_GWF2_35_54]
MQNKKPTVLVILDGWGEAPENRANAISLAKTPFMDNLKEKFPFTLLDATGEAVGLNENQMSGSEAGHINIGGGRVVIQDSYIIDKEIESEKFFSNPVLISAIRNAKVNKSKFHLMGLMSTADSQHSSPNHFRMLLRLAKKNGIKEVYCHLFSDGRDSYPKCALNLLENYKEIIKTEGIGKIASISGRFWAMDRAKNWDRLIKAYNAVVFSKGEKANSPEEAIGNAYKRGELDETVLPTVIWENNLPVATLGEKDSVVFFNFRSDRGRQFTKLFVEIGDNIKKNDKIPKIEKIKDLHFVSMGDFGPDLDVHTAFISTQIEGSLPIALKDKKQFYIAEGEKYAHMTYFFNGGYADSVAGEDRLLVPSLAIGSYAKAPEMSAEKITNFVLGKIRNLEYDFYGINFANADMVGHTGNIKATVKAVEYVDKKLAILWNEISKRKGHLIITADHGNADNMIDIVNGQEFPNTFHTKNKVIFSVLGGGFKNKELKIGGKLGNIAPTILEIMNLEKPAQMECNSLLN